MKNLVERDFSKSKQEEGLAVGLLMAKVISLISLSLHVDMLCVLYMSKVTLLFSDLESKKQSVAEIQPNNILKIRLPNMTK